MFYYARPPYCPFHPTKIKPQRKLNISQKYYDHAKFQGPIFVIEQVGWRSKVSELYSAGSNFGRIHLVPPGKFRSRTLQLGYVLYLPPSSPSAIYSHLINLRCKSKLLTASLNKRHSNVVTLCGVRITDFSYRTLSLLFMILYWKDYWAAVSVSFGGTHSHSNFMNILTLVLSFYRWCSE